MFRLYDKKLPKLCAWYSSDEEWPCLDEDLEKARPFRDGSKNLAQQGLKKDHESQQLRRVAEPLQWF